MTPAIACLILAYVLSQFYRACLAVLAPVLATDLGATAGDLANASGLWFLTFAAMQIPVGWALDRFGPRRLASTLLALGGGGGAALFAVASTPGAVLWAMALIGVGCAPVLMSSYYLFARTLKPARFGTMASLVLGIGTLGNVASATPLAMAVEALGWRGALWGLAAITLATAAALALVVRDPPRLRSADTGSVLGLLALPALWPIFLMMAVCYMPVAALRGFWLGPYYADVFGAGAVEIGNAALVMGLAMVAGTFAFGPLERHFRTRKWLILIANLTVAFAILGLWAFGTEGGWTTLALFTVVGLFGTSFPMVIAHGRAFVPDHLVGRGVTLLNLFGIASVGIAQVLTGYLHGATAPVPPEAPYQAIFLAIALVTLAGCAVYAFSQDRTD
jgi:MFS family permease